MAASTRGWTDRETSALLEALKTRESLWNSKCESYKNRNTKKKHLDEIVVILKERNSSNIERRSCPRPKPPSSFTFPSFFPLVNNKKCSYSTYHSCLPSTIFAALCVLALLSCMSPLVRVISGANGLTPISFVVPCTRANTFATEKLSFKNCSCGCGFNDSPWIKITKIKVIIANFCINQFTRVCSGSLWKRKNKLFCVQEFSADRTFH